MKFKFPFGCCAGISGMVVVTGAALALATAVACASSASDLEKGFIDPPREARPQTWWHWMNGNVTAEGITADLEAMKQIGLGGAQIFNVSESIPVGPVAIMSPQWRGLVKHAVSEADRLGLELCMHNCPGWSSSGGPWITPEHSMKTVVFTETTAAGPMHFAAKLPQGETRRDFYRDIAVLAIPTPADDTKRIADIHAKAGYDPRYGMAPEPAEFPAAAITRRDAILDLTAKLAPDGTLTAELPAGNWTILRLGYTTTGKENAPAPDSGRGLECDKLSRDGLDAHWKGMMGPVIADLGPLAGKVLNNVLIDSYEVGHQNWTESFREEFTKRRGYDPLLLLPTLTGRVVDSSEVSERFLWDFRRTIADLFADNYYSYFAELCHKNGLKASIEPYDGPFECFLAGRDADIPMGEFWIGGGTQPSCKLAASIAHTYGRPIVGSESFTAGPDQGRWLNDPSSLKAIGDLIYTVGINRFIIHRYAHQPWMDVFPGMTMGQWGTHFERTTTWWNQGGDWVKYLARSQFLLQQGRFAADVCYLAGEGAPNDAPFRQELKSRGFDYDSCNTDVLFRLARVEDGKLVLKDGMSYRVLVLPDTRWMTPALAEKLRQFVRDGLTVIGPRPLHAPSLTNYPASDGDLAKIAQDLWADCDGAKVTEHTLGKGRVVWGQLPEQVLASMKVQKDCEFSSPMGTPRMAWIHRTLGDREAYFVSNQADRSHVVDCTFRVSGQQPELWDAQRGVIEPAPVWSERDGRTTVRVRFEPAGSVFVVFRKSSNPLPHAVAIHAPGDADDSERPVAVVIRSARYEAIDGAGGADVTAKVRALVDAGETSIPADNATFGDPTFNHAKRLVVDYTLNGKPKSGSASENQRLELAMPPGPDLPPVYTLTGTAAGPVIHAFQNGQYTVQMSDGKAATLDVKSLPAPVNIAGPWEVAFPPNWGAPPKVTLEQLESWTVNKDPGVKYFSGTAEYQKEIDIPAPMLASGRELHLDLGAVKNLAEVELNGTKLGVLWKQPFTCDITAVARPGKNTLKIRVTNLWANRLIGDEQFPPDMEWNGMPIKSWPDWFVKHQPRPVKARLTFTTWHHYEKGSPLLDSGLHGPVTLRPAARVTPNEKPN